MKRLPSYYNAIPNSLDVTTISSAFKAHTKSRVIGKEILVRES